LVVLSITFVYYQSRPILKAIRAGNADSDIWFPKDENAMEEMLKLVDHLRDSISILLESAVFRRIKDPPEIPPLDIAAFKLHIIEVTKWLNELEAKLGTTRFDFLFGETASIVDLLAGCQLNMLKLVNFDFTSFPNLSRLRTALEQLKV
jgi:glutathione S-transferase